MDRITHAERVVQFLTERPHSAFDDDQIAGYLQIKRRQIVNGECRLLAQRKVIQRFLGPEGKLVNRISSP